MLKFSQEFKTIALNDLSKEASKRKEEDWRYVQTLAVNVDNGVDLIYSFMKAGVLENLKIESVTSKDNVKSITDNFIEAFVWENEIHDLFNITFDGIAIDFKGNFYNTSIDAPMTIVSPEVIERREKQAKIEAAMAAKAKKDAATNVKKEEEGE